VNVGNVTHFEDEESFLSLIHGGKGEEEGKEEGEGGDVMEVVEASGSAGPVSGSGGEGHVDYQLYKVGRRGEGRGGIGARSDCGLCCVYSCCQCRDAGSRMM
jgi:hypothetical protein